MVSAPKSAKEMEDELNPQPVQEEKKEVTPEPKPEPKKIIVGEKLSKLPDPVPAHWHIQPDEGDIVIATCSNCTEIFRGTVAEFNEALRNS